MSRREALWIGSLACVVTLLLAVPFAPGVVRAASEGGGHEGGLISLDRSLIVQLINFVILLVILTRLLYRPFLAKMRERTEAIQKSLEEAQAARAEAQRLLDSARTQMDADVRRAREELRRDVGELAISVAEKLIRKSLRDEEHRRIVDDAIAKVGH